MAFVPGSELSVSWEDLTIHVVALAIDPAEPVVRRRTRLDPRRPHRRARAASPTRSAQAGIAGAYEGAMRYVTSERLVSRTHFARFLVDAGHVGDMKDVFKRYLTPGKPGYVEHAWATLPEAIGWIHGAGGVAVLAHPGRYKVDDRGRERLLGDFRDAGGDAIEILSGSHSPAEAARFATYARLYGFAGSMGSDWHGPGEGWADLGDLPPLPAGVEPVWNRW